jgi:hypothetical protein
MLNMARLRETGVWFRLGADGSFMDEVYAHFEIGSGGDSYGSCGSKMGSFVSLKVCSPGSRFGLWSRRCL